MIVVVPRSKDAVFAYSKVTGQWTRQQVKISAAAIVPVVGDVVAAFQIGNKVFAFGAECGRWASVSLPADSKAFFELDSDCVTAQTAGTYHVFSPKTGMWSSINLEDGEILPHPNVWPSGK